MPEACLRSRSAAAAAPVGLTLVAVSRQTQTPRSPNLTFGLGGGGGAGNTSGDVSASQTGAVTVTGVDAVGFLAQSVGGGGGSGALNVTGTLSLADSAGFGIGIGGFAGDGANAGDVTVASNGAITVDGRASTVDDLPTDSTVDVSQIDANTTLLGRGQGLVAQSLGGGGGQGGLNVTGLINPRGSQAFSIGVGGSGGAGGNAGDVAVTRGAVTAAQLQTLGDQSGGLVAQSIGGGGGNAGMNFVTAVSNVSGGEDAFGLSIGVGGDGGAAGNGGATTVTHTGDILTSGRQSVGLSAQSIGGGGGNAALNVVLPVNRKSTNVNVAVGGGPSAGGTGDSVSVTHNGAITTEGMASDAIFAQSVGGGGGDTKLNIALDLFATNQLGISVGREGGTGGDAGNVTVVSNGVLTTTGEDSSGVTAQSVGGGGGRSGTVGVLAASSSGMGATAEGNGVTVMVGLPGASGGVGGNVSATTAGEISTSGRQAHGVFAQSVGGGGGTGGSAGTFNFNRSNSVNVSVGGGGGSGGMAGSVDVANAAMITTSGDEAHGAWALSVGGGGGVGGYTYAGGLNVAGAAANGSNTFTVSVGGNGGQGSDGGMIDMTNTGVVNTTGAGAFGVRAQSIGGGGGDGGAVVSGFLNGASGDSQSITVLVGGGGGDGGVGSNVAVTNEGAIATTGASAPGVGAQSIGGGGGDAGVLFAASIAVRGSNKNLGLTIGGAGGAGGTSGDVTIVNRPGAEAGTGQILTQGADSYGIFAQSIGGGGGNGSSLITASFASASDSALSAGLVIGGGGGSGNNAGAVTVTNAGLIDSAGDRAHGIFAQSIGGGGGNGGLVLSANAAIGQNSSSPFLAIGGSGGAAGNAGNVVVANTASIVTRGENAHGIFAQSIGGGGGNAAVGLALTPNIPNILIANALSAAIGAATGGAGGAPGEVTVTQNGDVTVLGAGSEAVKAEAVGGGGGTLAFDFEGITSLPGLLSSIGIGSQAPTETTTLAADANGIVTVEQIEANPDGVVISMTLGSEAPLSGQVGQDIATETTGNFATAEHSSAGFGLSSVGGGGGTAIVALGFEPNDILNDFAGAALDLGGQGGSGNAGGAVSSAHSGDATTMGVNSPGVLGQSIGGGGGRAVIIVDERSESFGASRFRLGATDSSSETGSTVSHTQTGNIMTAGNVSPGVLLQSIGGGGGSVGFADLTATDSVNADITAALGASGGANNAGGAVESVLSGSITTLGDMSSAVVLQSIGAGGGEARLSGVERAMVTLGGSNGAAGDGVSVSFSLTGDVTTMGNRSHGIFAQSIGGGGGAIFTDVDAPVVAFSEANSGHGGAVDLSHRGDIYVLGADSVGVLAQSIGGGGGFVNGRFMGAAGGAGAGGSVSFDSVGNIIADGVNSVGVLAQSAGDSGGAITLGVDGVIKGGSGDPNVTAAIVLDGGASNSVDVGENGFVFALSDRAFTGTSGDDAVISNGFVIGNIDLGGGVNRYTNAVTGALRTLDIIDLGADGLLTNAGLLAPGGAIIDPSTPLGAPVDANSFTLTNNQPQTTIVTGSVNLTDSSRFLVDASFLVSGASGGGRSDLITATGSGAIDGVVTPTLLTLERALPLVIIDPTTASADNGAEVTDTVVIDYSIGLNGATGDGATIDLLVDPDFSINGMTGNQRALGDHINTILTGDGSEPLGGLFAFIGNQTDPAIVIDTIDRLTPEGYAETLVDALLAGRRFVDAMMDCELLTHHALNLPKGNCVWMQAQGQLLDLDANFEFERFESKSFGIKGGLQTAINENWRFGVAGGYETIDIRVGDRFHSDGKRGHLGAAVRYEKGGLRLGAAASGSLGFHDNDRVIDIEGQIAEGRSISIGMVNSDHVVTQANLRLSASLDLETPKKWFYVTLSLALDETYVLFNDDAEKGAGPFGIALKDTDEWVFAATPGVEIGGRFQASQTTEFRPFVRGSLTVYSKSDLGVDAALLGAPDSSGNFEMAAGFDPVLRQISTGLAVTNLKHGLSLQVGYDGAFGARSTQHAAQAMFRFKF